MKDDEDKAYERWLQGQVGDAHEWAWPPARVVWKAAKAEAAEERESLQAEVERLRNIEAQAIKLSRAFATGSAWQKERSVKDLVERLAHQPERKVMDEAEMKARRRDHEAEHFGLLDHGQPTETAHNDHVKAMRAEFTPDERRLIRHMLFGDDR